MLYNIKVVYLHCVFHGIRFKVNEDWESGKIPFFFYVYDTIKIKGDVLKTSPLFLYVLILKLYL